MHISQAQKVKIETDYWIMCDELLPPKFKPVLCLLTNGCMAINWVNQPDGDTPFAHYIVSAWQDIEVPHIDIILKIPHEHMGTELEPVNVRHEVKYST